MNPIKFFGPPESSIMRAGGREDFLGEEGTEIIFKCFGRVRFFFPKLRSYQFELLWSFHYTVFDEIFDASSKRVSPSASQWVRYHVTFLAPLSFAILFLYKIIIQLNSERVLSRLIQSIKSLRLSQASTNNTHQKLRDTRRVTDLTNVHILSKFEIEVWLANPFIISGSSPSITSWPKAPSDTFMGHITTFWMRCIFIVQFYFLRKN